MKIAISVICLVFLITGYVSGQNPRKGESQITPELLGKYIGYLASDSMKGRNTPSRELDLAADYIANQFESMGVRKVNGSYFQDIPLISKNIDPDRCHFTLSRGQETKTFHLRTDYIPFEMTADTLVNAGLVFAGYGITAPDYGYDDYQGIDVKGKIVLVLKHEPGERDSTSRFEGKKDTQYATLNSKVENAKKHGAVGLLLVTDPLNHMLLTPQGYPWPGLSKFLPQDNLPVRLERKEHQIPVIQVGESVIKFLFGSVDSLKNLQQKIDRTYSPGSFLFTPSACELVTRLAVTHYIARNVIGMVEGRNPGMKSEYVFLGAHYDHVGYNKKHREGEDFIFNGADDNASGTAGVLAIAKAVTSLKTKPERSMVFILFAGEELGLYGSAYYCDHPLLPLDKTVAMLNMDMISRNGSDTLQLDGIAQNPDLSKILLKEAGKLKLKNFPPPGSEDLFKRSDHYNFFKKGISGMDITSGLHNDYHTVRDNPESADPVKAAAISKLIYRTAWIVANEKKYLATVPLPD